MEGRGEDECPWEHLQKQPRERIGRGVHGGQDGGISKSSLPVEVLPLSLLPHLWMLFLNSWSLVHKGWSGFSFPYLLAQLLVTQEKTWVTVTSS